MTTAPNKADAQPLVVLKQIVKSYQLGKTVVPALQGVDLEIRRGEKILGAVWLDLFFSWPCCRCR